MSRQHVASPFWTVFCSCEQEHIAPGDIGKYVHDFTRKLRIGRKSPVYELSGFVTLVIEKENAAQSRLKVHCAEKTNPRVFCTKPTQAKIADFCLYIPIFYAIPKIWSG